MPVKEKEIGATELQQEVGTLRGEIRKFEHEARVKREAAEQLKAEVKAAGHDPITGTSADDRDSFARIDAAYKESDELFERAAEYRRRMNRLLEHASSDALADGDVGDPEHPGTQRAAKIVRFGDRFVASEQYRLLKASGKLSMSNARVDTAPVEVATRDETIAALFGGAYTAATVVSPTPVDQQFFPPVEFPARQLRVRDLVMVSETDSDTVDYVEETTRTDAAAETVYGLPAPEATYVYTKRTVGVKPIRQFTPATKGNLADQGQLQSLIEGRLMYGVGKRLDGQMINGDGVGDNTLGILATTGIGGVTQVSESNSDVFHKALTVVRIALEDEPDAFLLHPTPYQNWILEKGTDGHYVHLQGPQSGTPQTIWGKPAVISTVVGANTALTGAWRQGATLWLREGINVAASDSHANFFIEGLVALLAEMRAAFAAVQPKAFCQITLV